MANTQEDTMASTYMIEDSDGTALTDGLQERDAYRVARQIARDRGESVYLWEPGADEAVEIRPRRRAAM